MGQDMQEGGLRWVLGFSRQRLTVRLCLQNGLLEVVVLSVYPVWKARVLCMKGKNIICPYTLDISFERNTFLSYYSQSEIVRGVQQTSPTFRTPHRHEFTRDRLTAHTCHGCCLVHACSLRHSSLADAVVRLAGAIFSRHPGRMMISTFSWTWNLGYMVGGVICEALASMVCEV